MANDTRLPMRICVVGGMASGKTYFTIHKIIKPAASTKRKILVLMLYGHYDYISRYKPLPLSKLAAWCRDHTRTAPRLIVGDKDELYVAISVIKNNLDCNGARPALVVFEDSTTWLSSGNSQANKVVEAYFHASRNLNHDLIIQCHTFEQLPKGIAKNATHYIQFKTEDDFVMNYRQINSKIGVAAMRQCAENAKVLAQYQKTDYKNILFIAGND